MIRFLSVIMLSIFSAAGTLHAGIHCEDDTYGMVLNLSKDSNNTYSVIFMRDDIVRYSGSGLVCDIESNPALANCKNGGSGSGEVAHVVIRSVTELSSFGKKIYTSIDLTGPDFQWLIENVRFPSADCLVTP